MRFSAAHVFERHSLGGMAIYFAIYVVMTGITLILICALSVLHLGIPEVLAMSLFVVAWLSIIVWLWLGMVRAGKVNKETKAHDQELFVLKLSFLIILAIFAFQAPFANGGFAVALVVVDWIFIALQAIYILLSLSVGAGMPLRNCVIFLVLLGLAIILTLRL